jgi:hypothetical protein
MTTRSPRVRPLHACVLGVALALTLDAGGVLAQSPSAAPPPSPVSAPAPGPVLAPPARLAPPPVPVATAGARGASPAPSAAPLRPAPAPASALPPDSVRPAPAAAAVMPPANAAAQCGDGTFVVAPSDAAACATHRGLLVRMPKAPPPAAAARAVAPLAVTRAAAASAAPPAGASMRCQDGTYLFGAPAPGRCDANGGLGAILPGPRTVPPAPALPRRP